MFSSRSFSTKLLIAFSIFLTVASFARAQITKINDTTSTPIPGAGHDYIHLLSETVNPANGSISVQIQVPMPKGRGLTIPFAFAYNSNGILHLEPGGPSNPGAASWFSNVDSFASGGWSYVYPSLRLDNWSDHNYVLTDVNLGGPIYTDYPCYEASHYLFMDGNGGMHSLGLGAQSATVPPQVHCPSSPSGAGGDAQFYGTLVSGSSTVFGLPAKVSDKAGTVYYFNSMPGQFPNSTMRSGVPAYIEDRNGNIVTATQNGNTSFSFTDTVGRTIVSTNGFGPSGATNTVTAGGLNYQITWKTVTGSSYSAPTVVILNTNSSCSIPGISFGGTVVSQITLPNGKAFHFYYGSDNPNPSFQNPYGLLSEIDYPGGGSVKYTWKLSDTMNQLAVWPGTTYDGGGNPGPNPNGCIYQYKTPVVASRQVFYSSSSSAAETQTFVYNTNWGSGGTGWTTKTTQATTTDNVRSLSALTAYTYSSYYQPVQPFDTSGPYPAQTPIEQSISYYDWGNTTTPVRTVNKTWANPFDLASQQTVLLDVTPNLTSQTNYSYATISGTTLTQPQEVDEYDFGATSPTRKTLTTYQSFSGTPGTLAAFPCKALVQNASSTTLSETDYLYDGGTTVCGTAGTPATASVSNLPAGTHDETLYGPSASTPRGNPTKIIHKCLQSCTDSTTTMAYDETGRVLSSTDACGNTTCGDMTGTGHTTAYSYANNFDSNPASNTNAFLTQITDPLGHISKFKYAYSDGQVIQSQDQNDITASRAGATYIYNDLLRRLTETDSPDGGQTTISYNDAAPSPSVTTTRKINSTQSITSVSTMDGLGHPVKSLLTSDPDCATGDRTDTNYDGFGRVRTVSNPYCIAGESTSGLTTFTYDALGRTTQVTHPDNTTVLTTYTGRATQLQDEGNGNGTQRVTRISQIDGLGRLLSLCEVAPGPFVGAGGSSSSSLIGSSGAPVACGQDIAGTGFLTSYQYDTLSNLLQVNQTGIAPRTFSYDSLSRLLTASNPESGAISYAYDANGNLSTKTAPKPNQTGTATVTTTYQYDVLNRLTQKSYNDGSTPTVSFAFDTSCHGTTYQNMVGRLEYAAVPGWSFCYGYDVTGRPLRKDLSMSVPAGTLYHTYAYDLLGGTTSETAGYGTASYGYNTAGRLTSVTSSRSDATDPPNVFSAAHYNAFGGLTSDTLGDGETETYTYVPHLTRLQSYTAKLNTTTLYNFNIGTFAPNGDILSANDTANGNWTYTYDPLNRLVGSNKNSGGAVYSYVYDRFGNRWQQNGPQTFLATFTGNNPGTPQNNNRMDGYSYDAAGNLLNDGVHNYKYDAENRIIQVDNGTTATYVYDAEGNRVQKTAAASSDGDAAGIKIYLYDQSGHPIQEFTPALWQAHIYAGSRHLATVGSATTFSHSDWLGTERVRTTYAGAVCGSIASLPFGDGQTTTGGCYHPSPLHFTGKQRDPESGLDNFGARYDSSSMGRFMSPDPEQTDGFDHMESPQAWNGYAYVHNNPLNATDPDGLDCIYVDENGKYQGFNRGDCDNSTEAKANSGQYVYGNVDTINLNGQGQVTGYSGTGDAPGLIISGTFQPSDPPSSNSNQLSPFAQGVLSQPVLKNAAGLVNDAGMAEYRAAGFIFPLSTLLIDAIVGSSTATSTTQAALRRKPGSLGEFKGTDALRKENKVARDIMKELSLGEDAKTLVHEALSEGAQMAGRKLTYQEGVAAVKAALGLLR